MRGSHLLAIVLAGTLGGGVLAGCTGAEVGAQVGYPSTVNGVGMIQIEPGVWVVDNDAYPTYFADNFYWYLDGGLWYRRPRWGGPWARVDIHGVPSRLVYRDHRPYRVYAHNNHGGGGGGHGYVSRMPRAPRRHR